jgi:hypothetical protein
MPLRGLGYLGDGRDIYIENHENRFADIERREGCGWGAGARTARQWGSRESGKQAKKPMFSIISRKVRNVRKGDGEMREEHERKALTRRRGGLEGGVLHKRTKRKQKGWLEIGRNVGIENHENRFADIERREESGWDAGHKREILLCRGWGMRATLLKRGPHGEENLRKSDNSPYEITGKHWENGADNRPTGKVIETRRPSSLR